MHHMWYWLVISVFVCGMSYFNVDPLKSSLLLVLSMISMLPVLSFSMHTWYSYFVCMLFLSGIFVIMVYFSSLCNYLYVSPGFGKVVFVFILCCITCYMNYDFSIMMLNSLYYNVYFTWFVFIVSVLIIFMNMISLILNFKGALRMF
uniref:NADH dehydrogenase subunit 6 n=1 Tax=Strongyloides vituli TaxID=553196 RepID=UPI0021B4FF84|nr:NADH dehydrogenase subunit 6 [Strongyloides vituli]UWI71774.1 NADH dehydrogenase subunit 6 [Strongyloides vituli]